jgi:hypothetical protein
MRIVANAPAPKAATSATVSRAGHGEPELLLSLATGPLAVLSTMRGAVVVDAPDVVVGASDRVVAGCFAVVGVHVGAAPTAAVAVGGGAIADGAVVAGGCACAVTGVLGRAGGFRGGVVVVVVVGTAAPDGSTPGFAKFPNANASSVPDAG